MPPAKMLTGYNDGLVAHWHYEKRALHDDGDDDRLEARMPSVVGPKMLTGDSDGPVAHWHYEYKNKRSLEARSPAKPEPDAENVGRLANWLGEYKRACPGCTLGNDGNVSRR